MVVHNDEKPHQQPVAAATTPELLTTAGFHGTDSDGNHYHSVEAMWEAQGVVVEDSHGGSSSSSNEGWYRRAAQHYRDHCPATIDGVLGGYASLSEIDLDGSRQFVRDLIRLRPSIARIRSSSSGSQPKEGQRQCRRACECGAGLGRVTKGLLLSSAHWKDTIGTIIDQCDLVESSSELLSAAPDYLGDEMASKCRFFCAGLQDWEPAASTYTLVWIQWVLSYLTDADIIRFLRRCGASLVLGGLIVLKENTCTDSDFEVDDQDASVTRSLRYWKYLIQQAGLRIVYDTLQEGLPDDIYSVPMLALEVAQE